MARYDDLKTGPIAYAAFVSSILLVIIILSVRALCYSWVEAEDTKKLANAHYHAADAAIQEQKARISNYDKDTVTVTPPAGDPTADAQGQAATEPVTEERQHITVERAMELLLEELSGDRSPEA